MPPQPAEQPAVPPSETPAPAPPEMPGSPPVQSPGLPPPPTPITGRFGDAARAVAAALFAVLAVLPAAHAQPAGAPVGAADRRFMGEATSSGMVEIVLGRLAQEKAVGEPVRHLGQQLVDDHIKANEALKALAAAKGVALPTGLTAEEKAYASHVKKLKGVAFDRTYLAKMVADHQKAVALFAQASSSASDPDVKAFAQTSLPTMRSHLEMAKQASSTAVTPPKRGTAARE